MQVRQQEKNIEKSTLRRYKKTLNVGLRLRVHDTKHSILTHIFCTCAFAIIIIQSQKVEAGHVVQVCHTSFFLFFFFISKLSIGYLVYIAHYPGYQSHVFITSSHANIPLFSCNYSINWHQIAYVSKARWEADRRRYIEQLQELQIQCVFGIRSLYM